MDWAYARRMFGWPDGITIEPGPRGALGRIWRVDGRLALKEIYAEPPSEAVIAAEQSFAGIVRIPRAHKDMSGRLITQTPDGRWMRLFDWVDLRPVRLDDPETPAKLGRLFARLHTNTVKMAREVGGEPPSDWYDSADGDGIEKVDPAETVLCHRDLHPENVLADPDGNLVVVDWDNLGPATPTREIAQALFDWYCDPEPEPVAMRALYEAYKEGGGPGEITRMADFSMLLAARRNFLRVQREVAADPTAAQEHRDWAEREIAETLRITPTREHLAAALTMAAEIDSSARRR